MPKGAKPEELQQRYQLNTIAVMTYIFPRQFKLHNVFTSKVDRTKTAQRYHDYTVRDTEIGLSQLRNGHPPKVPKRLRGAAMELVKSLQIRHARCSYVELLDHYCPSTINPHGTSREAAPRRSAEGTPKDHKSNVQDVSRHRQRTTGQRAQLETRHAVTPFDAVVDLASPMAHVSAFCRATLLKVIPDGFWGEGATMKHNKKVISRLVDHFVRLRRFETMSLHELMQGLKVREMYWQLTIGADCFR